MNPATVSYLTQREMSALLSAIDAATPRDPRTAGERERARLGRRDKACFLLSYRHGLRASEVGLLQWQDVDFQTLRITLRRLKGGEGGVYPLDADVARALKAYRRLRQDDSPVMFLSRNGNPIDRTQLHLLMRRYAEAAGIPADKRHFHCLRHTAGTHYYEASGDIHGVRDRLGHRKVSSTEIYAKVTARARERFGRDAATRKEIVG